MKANILDMARKKRLLKAEANKLLDAEATKRCRKCQQGMAKEADEMSKTHAALQSLHFLEITARVLGLGKIRIERILKAYEEDKDRFETDMRDGVAFTKMEKAFKVKGVEFEDHEVEMFRKFERVYEKGVIYDPSVKEWREYDETL
jgi:hypothetical protein